MFMSGSQLTEHVTISPNLIVLVTALYHSFSKYLTSQDTRGPPTLTKRNRTLARLGNLLYLQSRSTIKLNMFFFLSVVLCELIKKLDTALNW